MHAMHLFTGHFRRESVLHVYGRFGQADSEKVLADGVAESAFWFESILESG
jgi:hypothetical protein